MVMGEKGGSEREEKAFCWVVAANDKRDQLSPKSGTQKTTFPSLARKTVAGPFEGHQYGEKGEEAEDV